jgi:hypothetical protein
LKVARLAALASPAGSSEGFRMKKIVFAAGLVVAAGLMTASVGVASADSVLVSGNYATQAGCMADGPHVEVVTPGQTWTHFSCDQHSDGLWYLTLYN